jgi:hypothetical protein
MSSVKLDDLLSAAFVNAELELVNALKPPLTGSFGVVGGVVVPKALVAVAAAGKADVEPKTDLPALPVAGGNADLTPNAD